MLTVSRLFSFVLHVIKPEMSCQKEPHGFLCSGSTRTDLNNAKVNKGHFKTVYVPFCSAAKCTQAVLCLIFPCQRHMKKDLFALIFHLACLGMQVRTCPNWWAVSTFIACAGMQQTQCVWNREKDVKQVRAEGKWAGRGLVWPLNQTNWA